MTHQLNILCITLLLLFSSQVVRAQQDTTTTKIDNKTDILFSVEQLENYTVNAIHYYGNKVTKEQVIARELQFSVGDTIRGEELYLLLENSREDIRNLSLFNFVEIEATETAPNNAINITISMIERWYIWPLPILGFGDRNFNSWWETKRLDRLNYGLDIQYRNFRGRGETIDAIIQLGYTQVYQLAYTVPYINKKQTFGIYLSGGYSQSHEVNYAISKDNKQQFINSDNTYLQKQSFAIGEFRYRPDIYNTAAIGIRFDNFQFGDTVLILNPNYTPNGENSSGFFTLSLRLKSDYRNYKPYPLKGHYLDLKLSQNGVGNPAFSTYKIRVEARKYIKAHEKFYFASGFTGKMSTPSSQSELLVRGLGFGRDYVRGYEYYVINGQHFALLKNEFKFTLLKSQNITFNFIKSSKFNKIHYALYLKTFFDIGYVFGNGIFNNSSLVNRALPGGGFGFDFVTYYDLVFRVEYSFNTLGENGFFFHLVTAI